MRQEVREAYRCPCDGKSHRRPGRVISPFARSILATLDVIEKETGTRPLTCPWRTFADPRFALVKKGRYWANKHQLAQRFPDAPAWLWDAVEVYDRAIEACQAAEQKRQLLKLKAQSKRKESFREVARPRRRRGGR